MLWTWKKDALYNYAPLKVLRKKVKQNLWSLIAVINNSFLSEFRIKYISKYNIHAFLYVLIQIFF